MKQSWRYEPLEPKEYRTVLITRMIRLSGGTQQPDVTIGSLHDGIIDCGYAWKPMPGRMIDDGNKYPWVLLGDPDKSDNYLVVASEKSWPKIAYFDAKEMVFRGGYKHNPPLAWMQLPKPAKPPKILPTWCNTTNW